MNYNGLFGLPSDCMVVKHCLRDLVDWFSFVLFGPDLTEGHFFADCFDDILVLGMGLGNRISRDFKSYAEAGGLITLVH